MTLKKDGKSICLYELLYVSRSDGVRAHVTVFVPGMQNEEDESGISVAFLILDALLGEYVVESKLIVDLILPIEKAPDDARSISELPGELTDVPGESI